MDLSGIVNLFGYSVYAPQIDALLEECNASCANKAELTLYDSIESKSLGVDLWFWWKGYYRKQIADPIGTVEPEDSSEVVLYEVRFTPQGLANVKLPFGLSFPATTESVTQALGRKPFSQTKNVVNQPVWTYYEDRFELLVIFDVEGKSVVSFKIFALGRKVRRKLDLLENLKEQKKNIVPERIPQVEGMRHQLPTAAWERRMNSGDAQITAEAVEASQQVFEAFLIGVCKAMKSRNANAIYNAVTKATKAFNKIARKHKGFIETMEREEIVGFFNSVVQMTGLQIDPSFDLTEKYRSW